MDLKFEFIGWCHEDNHDKVWAALLLTPDDRKMHSWDTVKYVTIWGARGKKLQHKVGEGRHHDLTKLVDTKVSKGYERVSRHKLDQVYPEFENDLQSTAVWAMLTV